MEIEFAKKPIFGNIDGGYIMTKIKSYEDKINTYKFLLWKGRKKSTKKGNIMQMFVIESIRFCCQIKKKSIIPKHF